MPSKNALSIDRHDVQAWVERYCAEERNPSLPSFTVHAACKWNSREGGWWRSAESKKSGCYVVYDAQGTVLYIGKASLNASIGSRLAAHERSKDPKWNDASIVQIITVNRAFEAPSLEEYLIANIATTLNVNRGFLAANYTDVNLAEATGATE